MALVIRKRPQSAQPNQNPTGETQQESSHLSLPMVSLREGVVFPHTESVLVFGREASRKAIEAAEKGDHQIIVASQKDLSVEDPTSKDVYTTATLARVERTLEHEGDIHALIRGVKRVKIITFQQEKPFFIVGARELNEKSDENDEFKAKLNHLVSLFKKTIQAGKPVEFFNFIRLASGVKSTELIDHIASTLELPTEQKQDLLDELNVNDRLEKVTEYLSHEQRILNIEQTINQKTKKKLDERMRESILRERMEAIRQELGESEDEDIKELEDKLKKVKLPKTIETKVRKEISRLSQMSAMHSEYAYIHTWLETVLSLPWGKISKERTSLKRAEEILNEYHYGLDKVKERILEHLAVMLLKERNGNEAAAAKKAAAQTKKDEASSSGRASTKAAASAKASKIDKQNHKNSQMSVTGRLPTILCFVGPPGVGKTSIGRSIAEALGREFVKVSLGGIRDESEIRGHRRTYVGALPGRILQGIAQAETKNPVMMLDEIDKLGADFRGDPSAALLEALDPEQNHEFTDHYIGMPFDLSEVMFITTANVLDTIPSPLLDRMEIVEYSGYTQDEKFQIAGKYLIPSVVQASGLKPTDLIITNGALELIISQYTREAGVRNLKREIAKLARKAARELAEGEKESVRLVKSNVEVYLGPPKYLETITEKSALIGLVNGMAWTRVGGELLPIEASLTPGKEGITLTGQLGKVMQESAQAAFTYVKAHASELKIDPKLFEKHHVHVHVPEGAVPKDGPSAGTAMTTVLASVFTKRAVRRDVAMTGEVTLRGRVLPIGGLKEKLIAAHRAHMKTIFIPKQNEKDLVEIPKNVREDLTILPVDDVSEVLKKTLLKPQI